MTYTVSRWKLDALIPSADMADVEGAIKTFVRRVKKIEGWRKKLKASITVKDFSALLKDYEAMQADGMKLHSFAALRFNADTQDQQARALMGQVEQLIAESQNRTLF
ncbi:MAG: hypothetical protein HZB20_11850, partial [Chloroflexi bacterium]|nr:hypothetical protein [Chloroflexota bacterium]